MKSRFSTMMKFVALFNSIQMGKKARNMNLLLCACQNKCPIVAKQNNFFIVAYTCFLSFTLHANQQFLFFNKSLQEMRNDCHRTVAFGK